MEYHGPSCLHPHCRVLIMMGKTNPVQDRIAESRIEGASRTTSRFLLSSYSQLVGFHGLVPARRPGGPRSAVRDELRWNASGSSAVSRNARASGQEEEPRTLERERTSAAAHLRRAGSRARGTRTGGDGGRRRGRSNPAGGARVCLHFAHTLYSAVGPARTHSAASAIRAPRRARTPRGVSPRRYTLTSRRRRAIDHQT
jgi:hypothetical protein